MPPEKINANQVPRSVVNIAGNDFHPRYLAAKKSIDDRALNRHVQETLRRALARATGRQPLRILEVGAGIGAMLERCVDEKLLAGPLTYVATDKNPRQLEAAKKYLSQWAARRQGHALSWSGEYQGRLGTGNADITLELVPASMEALAKGADKYGAFHLLLAHAVLDLVDFPAVLPGLLHRLTPNGMAYLTCNFDGETVFLPEWKGEHEIIKHYHASMETRLTGASHTGRRLLTFLQRPGLELLAAGSSDWVIHPRKAGYAEDEVFFLHAMIETVEQELARKDSPPSGLAAWACLRRRQAQDGQLSFLARHLDLLVRRRGSLS